MSTRIRTEPQLEWDPPRPAFETDFIDTQGRSYSVSPDGRRLMVVKGTTPKVRSKIHVLTSWTSILADGGR